ncbi:MAG TPA: hypothetical protein VMR31_04985 [Myxococcota bacterium]|nr:hypothetical protein [Myxococcota bacterium]
MFRTPTTILVVAATFAAASLFVPARARAGETVITAHQVTLSVKSVSQLTGDSGNDKPDKIGINQKDLFTVCTTQAPTKTQGVYVFFDCAGPPPGTHTLLAIDTQPVTFIANVGTMTFGEPLVRTTSKGGTVLNSIKVPVTVNINCNGGTTTATLDGILNLNYKAFPNGGPMCPNNGTLKITGFSDSTGVESIVDDGSSMKVNTRNGGITTIPGPS